MGKCVRGLGAGLLAVLVTGCGAEDSVRVSWAQWFSFASIASTAVGPDGAVTVAGWDNGRTFALGGPSPRQPFIARIEGDGELGWRVVDALGSRLDLIVDDEGTTYHRVTRPIDLEDPESSWFSDPGADCFVEARDVRGNVVWTWRRGAEVGSGCAVPRGFGSGTLVLESGSTAYGVSSQGQTVWEVEVDTMDGQERWATGGGYVWGVDEGYGASKRAVRIDPTDGSHETFALDHGWVVEAIAGSANGVVLLEVDRRQQTQAQRLVQLDSDGEVAWSRLLQSWEVPDPTSSTPVALAALQRGTWVVGSESIPPVAEGEGDPEAPPDLTIPTQHRIVMQRHGATGQLEHRVRRTFAEDPDAPRERRQCLTDAITYDDDGSRASFAAVTSDGALVITGRQGCRDGFVMRVEVPR